MTKKNQNIFLFFFFSAQIHFGIKAFLEKCKILKLSFSQPFLASYLIPVRNSQMSPQNLQRTIRARLHHSVQKIKTSKTGK